ncbi:MAG: hypothetical protein HYW57_01590 [Ignavibacteriales bacterium]|nr:hypothetical protein [Ignavibacteriales bacterium]
MPGLDGFDTLKSIRKDPSTAATPYGMRLSLNSTSMIVLELFHMKRRLSVL